MGQSDILNNKGHVLILLPWRTFPPAMFLATVSQTDNATCDFSHIRALSGLDTFCIHIRDKKVGPYMRTLVIVAHPGLYEGSRINRELIETVRHHHEVTVHDLYHRYPDGHIDIEAEHQFFAPA